MPKDQELLGLNAAAFDISYDARLRVLLKNLDDSITSSGSRSEDVGWALKALAEGYRRNANLDEALHYYYEAEDVFRELKHASGIVWSLWGIATIKFAQLEVADSRSYLSEALQVGQSGSAEAGAIIWIRARLAEINRIQGHLRFALEEHLALRVGFEELGDKRGVAWAVQGCAQIYKLLGDLEASEVSFDESLTLSEQIDDPRGVAFSWRGLASLKLMRQDFEAAYALQDRAVRKMKALGYSVGEIYCLLGLIRILLASSLTEEGHQLATSTLKQAFQAGDARAIAYSELELANVMRDERDVAASLEAYSRARSIFERGSIALGQIHCLLGEADVFRCMKDRPRLLQSLVECRQMVMSTDFVVELYYLRLLELMSDEHASTERFEQVRSKFQDHNMLLVDENANSCWTMHLKCSYRPLLIQL